MYTSKIIRANADADPTLLGVQLGKLCIFRQIAVTTVAQDLNVTKSTVYRWFLGQRDIGKHLRQPVLAYYRHILPPDQ